MLFRAILIAAAIAGLAISVMAQETKPAQTPKPTAAVTAKTELELPRPEPAITNSTSAKDLARASLAAHGGEKFRQAKTIFLTGTADLSAQNFPQTLSATFAMTYKGEMTRMDVKSAVFNFTMINDGVRSYSSFKGLSLPSLNKFSTRLLAKIDQPGYVISELPNKKKYRAFRITDPDGDATDFYIDPATGRVMMYEFNYENQPLVVEHDKFRIVDGVLVPEKFAQRFETQNMGAMFAEFKVKQAQLNIEIADDVFAIPEH